MSDLTAMEQGKDSQEGQGFLLSWNAFTLLGFHSDFLGLLAVC